jgi:hypothetical protein
MEYPANAKWRQSAEGNASTLCETTRHRNACNGKLAMATPHSCPILSRSSSFTLQQVSRRADRSPFSTQHRYLSGACHHHDGAGAYEPCQRVVQACDLATPRSLRWGANYFATGDIS